MDFDWIAFGNAYYVTEESVCGGNATNKTYTWDEYSQYNASVRECFNKKCGNESAPSDCFTPGSVGGPVCQHGAAECAVNLLQMCGKKVEPDYRKYAPFGICLESKYETISSSVKKGLDPNMTVVHQTVLDCANETHFGPTIDKLDVEPVIDCFTNTSISSAIQINAAKATPTHPGTPFVQVTNKTGTFVLDLSNSSTDDDILLKAVCEAYKYNGGALTAVKGCTSEENTLVI